MFTDAMQQLQDPSFFRPKVDSLTVLVNFFQLFLYNLEMKKRSYLILFVSYTFVQCESPLQEPADVGAVKGQEHEGTNTSRYSSLV